MNDRKLGKCVKVAAYAGIAAAYARLTWEAMGEL